MEGRDECVASTREQSEDKRLFVKQDRENKIRVEMFLSLGFKVAV